METAFKILFVLAVIVFCILVIGLFLLAVKIGFLFTSEITILGVKMVPAGF